LNRSKKTNIRSISKTENLTSQPLDDAQRGHLFERLFPEMLELKRRARTRMGHCVDSFPQAANF
jgi:hypothetical protein